jgi:hypothetical protein
LETSLHWEISWTTVRWLLSKVAILPPNSYWWTCDTMNRISSQLAKQQPKLFKVNYTPEYKTFIINHVVSDPSHPLHEAQKRLSMDRKQEGIWWHVTTGGDLSKSSCVRSWSRRRLRNAIVEELKAHGYDENGKFVKRKASDTRENLAATTLSNDLRGSLRLHALAPLIPAKYVDVKTEVGQIIKTIVAAMGAEKNNGVSIKKSFSRLPRKPPPEPRQKRSNVTRQ